MRPRNIETYRITLKHGKFVKLYSVWVKIHVKYFILEWRDRMLGVTPSALYDIYLNARDIILN
jgi:hypothetical protein